MWIAIPIALVCLAIALVCKIRKDATTGYCTDCGAEVRLNISWANGYQIRTQYECGSCGKVEDKIDDNPEHQAR